jgi:hypothetical protein
MLVLLAFQKKSALKLSSLRNALLESVSQRYREKVKTPIINFSKFSIRVCPDSPSWEMPGGYAGAIAFVSENTVYRPGD